MLAARLYLALVTALVFGLVAAAGADAAVLFEQSGEIGSSSSPSIEYSAAPAKSSQTADDFTIPASTQWTISSVHAVGINYGGRASQEVAVYFFPDAGGFPATDPVYTEKLTMSTEDPHMTIPLATPAVLGPGKFWFSVQVLATEETSDSTWYWSDAKSDTGSTAAYRNGAGPCHTWGGRADCQGLDGSAPGQLFSLSGSSGPAGVFVPPGGSGPGGGDPGGKAALPSNAFTLGKLTLNRKKGIATLGVTVAAAGALSVGGKNVKSSTVRVAGPGQATLTIKAKGKAKKKLSKSGKTKLKLEIAFSPTGGTSASQTLSATLKVKTQH